MKSNIEIKNDKVIKSKILDRLITLGDMYYHGFSVEQDYCKAIKYYKQAAEQGHTKGLVRLGRLYFLGHGTDQDTFKAYSYWKTALLAGYTYAKVLIDAIPNQERCIYDM